MKLKWGKLSKPTAGLDDTLSESEAPLIAAGLKQTASKLHAFNRYEIKYLVDERKVPAMRDELSYRMINDVYSPTGGYPVTSLYYDTEDMKFYWEKIEGLKFRRKVRLRYYGAPESCTDSSPVHVEIKQRVNRVTQKRRIQLPYAEARNWLDNGVTPSSDSGFISEVSRLKDTLGLRPIVTTGYHREAFVGTEADNGLRVTIDHMVQGRDRSFSFSSTDKGRFIIPPKYSIMEIKANERIPYWVTDMMAIHNMSVVRISKYCQSVQAFNLAPQSRYGTPQRIKTQLNSI